MKDSAVDPPGLFDPRRQIRLLSGLAQRCRSSAEKQRELMQRHSAEKDQEEQSLASSRGEQTDECRRQRRQMLDEWDATEEKLTATYEANAIKTRQQVNRLSAIFRKKLADGQSDIGRKVDARREAVVHQYEIRKSQPIDQMRAEIASIDDSLDPMQEDIEWARALTVRRLDGLPAVPPAQSPEENMAEVPPKSVTESVDTVYRLTRKLKSTVTEMQTGAASKIVDSFYLPAGVAVFIVVWIIGVLLMKFDPPWIPMVIGIVTGGVLGFVIYAILLWPLKKMTRQLYPRVERIVVAAEEAAQTGRDIAKKTADELSQELIDRRKSHLAAADRWKLEQLAELESGLKEEQREAREKLTASLAAVDEKYLADYANVSSQMHTRAESLAIEITDALSQTDQNLQSQREASQEFRRRQLERLAHRLKQGVNKGMQKIALTDAAVQERFAPWQSIVDNEATKIAKLDYLPLGALAVADNLRQSLSPADQADANGVISDVDTPQIVPNEEIPASLPVVLHRRLHSAVVVEAAPAQMENAIELAHQILWRTLTGVSPSRVKLTLIDPLGRGQHFTSFMALADHDPSLVGHRVWTSESNIDQRLGEIAHHVEDVLQSSLRDRFQRIEDYNDVAGSMAEPYRIVAGVGLPEGLTRSSYKHLLALIESGIRCGVFTVIVTDSSKPWPGDMPMPTSDKLLKLKVDESGSWHVDSQLLGELPFQPYASPPSQLRNALVEKIGTAAVAASRVEIPLRSLLEQDNEGEASTDDGIDIVVGTQGANRSLSLNLGEGVRQHVLIAGKTGSGKSTLLHSIITSGAFHYRPDQLHFYLLDFKKGVEFKPYADHGMPHARVIGIESEREFGRSVLQRLDAELQERGEKFRSYGVQELSEYRGVRGDELPRIMLVIDEFQELFVRDDRLAGDCAMLLDRLVRQGRSFGMHVVLSSQSLAGAFSLPRATLGQMAVRIAMQCSESDAALILSDDNTAARLISRPGEAIYNDAGGLVEGNHPFQVAWLSSDEHKKLLARISKRDDKFIADYAPPVVFEGNRPCAWSGPLADTAIKGESKTNGLRGFLGESVEIGPPATLELTRNAGRNVLLITPPESRSALIASTVSSFIRSHPKLQVLYFDGTRADDAPSMMPWLEEAGISAKQIKPRDSEAEMVALNKIVKQRGDDSEDAPPIIAIIDPLDRFREFRQDDSFSFSLDSAAADENGPTAMREVLRDGPAANVFVFLICGGAETLSRWLPRASQHDLELRLLGRMNASDSSVLIDSPIASELSAATMLLYDDSDGRIMKFRQCDFPDAQAVSRWLAK
ncbi:FtsK/SpoIIIE domain-containing protein [Planctomycetes bacterium K23_9]|uniref:FtsK-like domain-containing protein n=1 Tax=Stieleria marina TaxID=1930275 RepID=A0A517P2L6_9BACT|nr:FtsK-like domain-containing protein [Planctomycetes bacterium K23_9]